MRHGVIWPSGHVVIGLATAMLLAPAAAQQSAPIALRGGKVMTITRGTIENGVVVMEAGKITAVGKAGEVAIPKGARVIDVKGMTVYPGLIDSESNLGLTEITLDPATNDLVEPSDAITPHMHVYEAFHAETELIPETRLNGVTNAIVAPTKRNTLPGQSSLIQLDGRSRDQMLLVRDIALPLNFTGEQRRNESFATSKFPATRMGMAAQLRQALIDAQDYARRRDEYEKRKAEKEKDPSLKERERPKRDLKLEALLPYLDGKRPVVLAAEEGSDLKTALSLAAEFKLKVVLNHIAHSQDLLDEIAALKAPVIVGPIYRAPKDDERYDTVYRLPAELAKRGVKFAFASYDSHDVRRLPYAAGYSVAFGLPYEEAMKALTIYPAEIWGVAESLGSLEPGKTANVVVANGDPLDVKTEVKHVFIAGREIPMESRQTKLRDQYGK
jgi:imidazolonepropionase-like amidohydrolase